MRVLVALGTVAIVLALPPAASAAIKVQAPPRQAFCGDALSLGVRAPAGTKGSRVVRVRALDAPTGTTWFSRRATAGRHWRHWLLPSGMDGRCNPTRIVYSGHRADGSRWVKRFKVLFRTERL